MPYTVELNTAAQRDYSRLDHSVRTRVSEAIDRLEVDPRPRDCVKLVGQGHHYRVRVGTYRVVYTVDDQARHVSVKRIQHRREVYR